MNYYNEFEPYAAQWLRNLIAARLIPAGDVDTRSITDVQPDDLAGYRQCHFFAGIGGWSLAARLAGWPDDRELWTGSAPCQPFSVAGKGKAQADDRHLWPHLFRLARARRPAVLMGEQVAAAVGKDWIDGVFTDLEGIGYACGASVVPACAVDAPHRRDRLWFVAHADLAGSGEGWEQRSGQLGGLGGDQGACTGRSLADAGGRRLSEPNGRQVQQSRGTEAVGGSEAGRMADADGITGRQGSSVSGWRDQGGRSQPWAGPGRCGSSSAWSGANRLIGHDGKARRFEPGIRLLAHGVPARVGKLRAGGNAIVPQVAAEVIGAYMDSYPEVA